MDGDRWVAAVVGTAGQVVRYQGSVIQAFYAASDGGYSEDVEDVWHGGNPAYAIPYLRGVCDPGEYTSANPWTDWTRTFSASSVSSRLAPYTGGIGTIRRFTDVRRGESGRIVRARSRAAPNGSASVSGSELRSALGLPDGRVWINTDRNIVGAVRAKYDALMCRPGLPRSTVVTLDHGSRQLFQRGGIYRNGQVGLTVWLKGAIHDEYLGAGGARGRLGLPVSNAARAAHLLRRDLLVLPTDRPRGRADLFQGRRGRARALGTGAVGLPRPRWRTGSARVPDDTDARGERRPDGFLRARFDLVRERVLRRQRELSLSTGPTRSPVLPRCTRSR